MKTKFALLLSMVAIHSAQAGIIFTTEAAGVQQTSLTGTITETFNLLPTGALGVYNSAIGQYSAGSVVSNPNAWGGANQTLYLAVGAQSNTTSYSLNFSRDLNYFGLNWQAGDAKNELRFLNHGVLIQAFSTSAVFASLNSSYSGNPNTGQNTSEKYAFFNFYATGGTLFDQVVFYNNGTSTGFETDNHTILKPSDPLTPTTEAETPEPATLALVGVACLALAAKGRYKQ
jgi:hypothetical protein